MDQEIAVRGTGEVRALPDAAPGEARGMALAVAGADATEPAEDLTPGELTVRAVVEVGFRIV